MREAREDIATLAKELGTRHDPASVRGRLHKIEGLLGSFVVRRSPGLILKGWERLAVVLCAIATAAAAWYGLVIGH